MHSNAVNTHIHIKIDIFAFNKRKKTGKEALSGEWGMRLHHPRDSDITIRGWRLNAKRARASYPCAGGSWDSGSLVTSCHEAEGDFGPQAIGSISYPPEKQSLMLQLQIIILRPDRISGN